MTTENETKPTTTVAVIGAAGKMGRRVSDNLVKSDFQVLFSEASPQGQQLVRELGRTLTESTDAAARADIVILAVPDIVLGAVSEQLVPLMRPGTVVLTLDPAAAYAGLLLEREDIHYACAHPCHPSVFLERTTKEEWQDTFGGIAAPQEVVAAYEGGDQAKQDLAESVIRQMYAPVIDVHWVTVKQLAVLEPTLVETIACMVGALLTEALHETVHTVGVPEKAARAMLLGHTQVALANTLKGSNPFSDACLIAMDYGRESIVRDDWKKVFDDDELDRVITRMLKIKEIRR
ncbi:MULTISPECIES: phosphogluconate dehydrogenase C-terminal domain-containing protein [Streptomyces]|uniref:phosphogluconate dehydrogenase C-terminal domain-containing protein n=1 Tax=Streptomyces TaxID=1883 RepID=UPI00103AD54A|nr:MULTISPECIES: phosphogluconate dehydrogenase C-terminal domain-containing protein [Streptomyces]MBT3074815.1 NAD(P)-binding domain-containing protein [Streptomyces sp. COG21]MBT3081868.1 NAD(P)-binding domain-containing protein [Streptomyces sp. COG20]MBT3085100.1 NAD(P)-binding domain-containing protein [Streptomyces sp. CYG21]MBT3098133.1 NAD(P)-binding domain-containing protein [Streptomyces sp. CBG30]MBT3105799.1 NAD(P)-binding domain-containing protein [Streptomyces sp. COG19]